MEGKAWGDPVAVGLSCYGDSSVCKDCGVTWLLLSSLDSTREMGSCERRLNTCKEPRGLHNSFEGILHLL